MLKALAESVNTFFYYIGGGYDNFSGLGINKMIEYLSLFGLGQQGELIYLKKPVVLFLVQNGKKKSR